MRKLTLVLIGVVLVSVSFVILRFGLPANPVKEIAEVDSDFMGQSTRYWISETEVLIGEPDYQNAQIVGVRFSRVNPETRVKAPLQGLTDKIGKSAIRWQLSPDRKWVLALLKEGATYRYITLTLEGTEEQSWKVDKPQRFDMADFSAGWVEDSKRWVEFQEMPLGKEKDNVIVYNREQPQKREVYTLATSKTDMMARQYQNLFDGYKVVQIPFDDWGASERKGPARLQIKDFRANKPPLKEYPIEAPKGYNIAGTLLSPDRTLLAWVCFLIGTQDGKKDPPSFSIWITRLDTKETKKVVEMPVSIDNYQKNDWDKYVLPAWTPDSKRLSFFIERKFYIANYADMEKTPPAPSSALSLN